MRGSSPDRLNVNFMKAVFLDRDGVINEKAREADYIARWEDLRYMSDVFTSVAALQQAGFKIIIVTNQRGVALCKVRRRDLEIIHTHMREDFSRHGVCITEIYVCPHNLADHCSCRKPRPGMLIRAARDHALDLSVSWMVGDSESDMEAGKRAGCRTARILSAQLDNPGGQDADIVSNDLASVVSAILRFSQIPTPAVGALSPSWGGA